MRRKKLGIYGITLVILAGLFQLITFPLNNLVDVDITVSPFSAFS